MNDPSRDNWVSLYFDQGDEASRILHVLLRFDGQVTYRGETEKSVRKALKMLLKHVPTPEPTLPVYDGISWGSSDSTIEEGEYLIAYNSRFGYISLNKKAGV